MPAVRPKQTGRRSLSMLALLLGLAGCTKEDSLVLLDLRPSGPLGAPVARIRLSAKGWTTRTVDGAPDVAGFHVGYYGPGDGGAVTVTAEALDAADCVLGSGSATVPALEAGAISAPATLFVRPEPTHGCVPDGGTADAGSDGGGTDAGGDAKPDAGDETETDAAADERLDTVAEAGTDATPDGGAPDGNAPDGNAPDAGAPDGGAPDAGAPDGGGADGGAPDAGASDGDDDASGPDAALD